MAEELKELIEKIQLEGVRVAEDKALGIETAARKRAEEIIASAAREVERMRSEAGERIKRLEEGSNNSVKQAARDTLLSLKRDILSMLERVVAAHVHKALGAEDMGKMLVSIIKASGSQNKTGIVVSLKKEDVEKVEKALLAELGHEVKKGITLKSAADIHGGFLISYDSGKSYFDFSDKALADYLSSHLKAGLGDIVKEAASK